MLTCLKPTTSPVIIYSILQKWSSLAMARVAGVPVLPLQRRQPHHCLFQHDLSEIVTISCWMYYCNNLLLKIKSSQDDQQNPVFLSKKIFGFVKLFHYPLSLVAVAVLTANLKLSCHSWWGCPIPEPRLYSQHLTSSSYFQHVLIHLSPSYSSILGHLDTHGTLTVKHANIHLLRACSNTSLHKLNN